LAQQPCRTRVRRVRRKIESTIPCGYKLPNACLILTFTNAVWLSLGLYADGDVESDAGDLLRFDRAIVDGKLIAAKTLATMLESVVVTPMGFSQALAFETYGDKNQSIGHHGGVPGFRADDEIDRTDGVDVVVLGDADGFDTGTAKKAIFATLLPTLSPPAAAANASPRPEDPAITARFRSALAGLLDGRSDRNEFSDAASANLTPELLTATAQQLRPPGTIVSVTYLSATPFGPVTVYSYDVTFSSGQKMVWWFSLDGAGKIADHVGPLRHLRDADDALLCEARLLPLPPLLLAQIKPALR